MAYDRPPKTVRSPRNGWLSKVVYPASRLSNRLFNYAFGKPLPKPALPPPLGSFLFPLFLFCLEKTLCIISHIKLLLVQR